MVSKAAVYSDIAKPFFIQGYLIVMEGENKAIRSNMASRFKELMSDSELYGWDKVRTHNTVWLNQLEQGRVCWDDDEGKLSFQHVLFWHPVTTSTTQAVPNSPQPGQKQQATTYKQSMAPRSTRSSTLKAQPPQRHVHLPLLFRSNQEALHTSREALQAQGTGPHGQNP